IFNVALNYGGRAEIVDAVNRILRNGGRSAAENGGITEKEFAAHLYTAGLPDPDLLIRTSGELRISNFLLWQIAYAEIWVTDTVCSKLGLRLRGGPGGRSGCGRVSVAGREAWNRPAGEMVPGAGSSRDGFFCRRNGMGHDKPGFVCARLVDCNDLQWSGRNGPGKSSDRPRSEERRVGKECGERGVRAE